MRRKIYISITLAAMLLSCTKTEPESTTALPEGKYPLKFTAEITSPLTRSGGKDAWTGGEKIGVNMDGMLSPKKFVIEADGSARPADAENAIWWKNTDEARITAWHPDIVAPALDISDQSGGYADFDLVWATALGRYNQDIVLQFRHRMAKVEFSLAAGDGITEEELAGASVKVLGDDEAYFSIGMVGAADKSDGEIAPCYDSVTKKFEAVVVPQDMTGKPLIRIGLGGKTFAYTPSTEAAGKLDAGACHSYAITVKANGLEVQTPWGYDWSAGGEENVTSQKVRLFKVDELKIGDYFYSDGTWSDGGLRKLYENGNMVLASPKPAPLSGKTVVGIVFQTDPNRIGAAEKAKLGEGNVHGLVVAVKDAANNVIWGDESRNFNFLKNCGSKSDTFSDINGLDNYTKVIDYAKQNGKLSEYSAFEAVNKWNASDSEHKVPGNTTGWYLPSAGQLYDFFANLGGLPDWNSCGESSGYFTWTGQGEIVSRINSFFSTLGDGNYDPFLRNPYSRLLWTSSKYNNNARYWIVWWDGAIYCQWTRNTNLKRDVRPVLAF